VGSLKGRCSVVWLALILTAAMLGFGPSGTVLAPPSALAVECEGDECQGPAPAPEDPTPGTAVVEGPQNPPASFPKSRHKKPHGKNHHKKHRRGARQRGRR
jgi:hypothetical protein